ncbi:hypothetical protein ABK040_004019 [Willaertia magna]
MNLIEGFKSYLMFENQTNEGSNKSLEEQEFEGMVSVENEIMEMEATKNPSFRVIPRFFFPSRIERNSFVSLSPEMSQPAKNVQNLFKSLVKELYLERCSKKVLTSSELDRVWELLLEKDTGIIDNATEKINYKGYKQVATKFPEFQSLEFFKPSLFLKLPKDDEGRVAIPVYFNHILRKVSLIQNRLTLMKFDKDNDGYLTEKDVEEFVNFSIDSFLFLNSNPTLKNEQFRKIYIETGISLDEFVGSKELIEFNELQNDDLSEEEEMNNWFSIPSVKSVYEAFVQLDFARNGILGRNEFSKFNNGSLTTTFINRMFQEYATKNGKMEYKTFVDFLLAYENRKTPQSIKFFFQVLDNTKVGYLTPFVINFYFRDMLRKIKQNSNVNSNSLVQEEYEDPVKTADIIFEIYSMVKPKDKKNLTFEDLCKSLDVGATVVGILTDVQEFWKYEQREEQQAP